MPGAVWTFNFSTVICNLYICLLRQKRERKERVATSGHTLLLVTNLPHIISQTDLM